MNWILLCLMLLPYFGLASSKDIDTNDINSQNAPINLDSNLRKALLKALTELENEEIEKQNSESSGSKINLLGIGNEDDSKSFQRASASAVSIITNSETTDRDAEITTVTTSTYAPSLKPIVVIQRSRGLQQDPITTFLQSKEQREQFLTSLNKFHDPKDEVIHTRSVNGNGIVINPNSVFHNDKSTTFRTKESIGNKIATTTAIPIPVTEEHEAKVEDVQFFPAPLVAAFTVHQDASGLPNKVEPIYKLIERNTLAPVRNTMAPSPTASTTLTSQSIINTSKNSLENQFFLREKQNALEQHIYNLQQQQLKQQEYLIHQQRIIQEQEEHLMSQRLLSEQNKLISPHVFPPPQQLSNQLNLNTNTLNNNVVKHLKNVGSTFVSLQQSLPLNPSPEQLVQAGILPQNAQILPVKNAINFLSSPYNPINFSHFNEASSQYHPQQNLNNNFHSFHNNFVQTLPSTEPNKFFRQENSVLNFRNNIIPRPNNNFIQYVPSQTDLIAPNANRLFRSNAEGFHISNLRDQRPAFVNQQLNNLLYQSGISRGVRQSEDLGIVSKVLSFNFGRDGFARADV